MVSEYRNSLTELTAGTSKQGQEVRKNLQSRGTSKDTPENHLHFRKVLEPVDSVHLRKVSGPRKVFAGKVSYRWMDFNDPRMGNIPRNVKSENRGDEFLYQLHLRHIKEGRSPYAMKIKSESSVFDRRKGNDKDVEQNVEDLLKGI